MLTCRVARCSGKAYIQFACQASLSSRNTFAVGFALAHGSRRSLVTAESVKPMKRFYNQVHVQEVKGEGWEVRLDHRIVKTPKKSNLTLPTLAVAEAVAEEWRSQPEYISAKKMPMMTIACTAVDMVRPDIDAAVDRMLPYLRTDTICYEEQDGPLAQLQQKEWGPLRMWYEGKFKVSLGVATGLCIPDHGENTFDAIALDLKQRNEWELCGLEIATNTAKSLIVATALIDREDVDAEYALRWALLEEFFQIDRWGLVEGEHDVSHEEALLWLGAVQEFVALSGAKTSTTQ